MLARFPSAHDRWIPVLLEMSAGEALLHGHDHRRMQKRTAIAPLLLLALVGCGPARAPDHAPQGGALASWSLAHAHGPAIGTPCDSPGAAAGIREGGCGRNGRVALEVRSPLSISDSSDPPPPCELRTIGEQNEMYLKLGCVEGDHLVLSSTCRACRMPGGLAVHAVVSELTAAQQAQLHEAMKLEAERPTTIDGWKALLARGSVVDPRGH